MIYDAGRHRTGYDIVKQLCICYNLTITDKRNLKEEDVIDGYQRV
jgi:hypothetical protein